MQKSQPKEYWKFLNSLKQKKNNQKYHQPNSFTNILRPFILRTTQMQVKTLISLTTIFENPNEFLNCPFTPKEIDKCIRKLKNAKSSGHDSILNEYLKLTKDSMLPVYVALFNLIPTSPNNGSQEE